ncbi:hypothetical protein [Acetobacter estunensis]|uniref:hypothetical protein n=1 Tax=Acetobacter estunensis TaxID=104097 RepID=UPI001C2D113C|nr:hypothetical protein [Acetobacter estunensis]MBV1836740.1 hypothetical protein [Acetobacter estunensis]
MTLFSSISLRACLVTGGIMMCGVGTPLYAQTPVPADTEGSAEDIAPILSRPLFEPDRRAKGVTHGEAGAFHLVGISGHAGAWRAIFRPEKGDGRSRILSEGEKTEGWTITSIAPSGVTLAQNGNTKHVAPVFSKYAPPPISEKQKIDSVHIMSHKRVDPHLAW